MNLRTLVASLAVLAVPAAAIGQDSVSKQVGLPGDAVSAYNLTEQVNDYVLDLTPFDGSWGTPFGIGPLMKASLDDTAQFFTHLLSAQNMSSVQLEDVPFARSSYSFWNAPGFGVNGDSDINDPGTPIDTSQLTGLQFGAVFSEFGGSSNNSIAAVVNMLASDPTRLYVSRVSAAQNADSPGCKLAGIGGGSIDANGNLYFRSDDFGVADCNGKTAISGNNYFSVDALARNASVQNVISAGFPGADFDAGATAWLVRNDATVHNCPTNVPESVAGAPFILGTNFNDQWVRGTAFPLTSDGTHLDPASSGQRGNPAYTPHQFTTLLGSSELGTFGMLAPDLAGDLINLNLCGIGIGGVATGTAALTLPPVVTDNSTGFQNTDLGPGVNEFGHYRSQVSFQGGNGPLAIGKDEAGNLIAAGVVYYPEQGDPDNFLQYIAVARVSPAGATEWTMAGYNNGTCAGDGNPGSALSKPILDGPGGNTIGQMVPLLCVTGGAPLGPSVSAPMIDSAGNVWFLSAVELFKVDGKGVPFSDFDTALLRAVYNPATFAYELELVMEVGDVFRGQNSDTDYQIRFLSIADGNSVSSGTMWSGNMTSAANPLSCTGQDVPPRNPGALGGLVVSAQIVYDTNDDGTYDTDPASGDQTYNSLLYIGSDPCQVRLSITPDTVTAGDAVTFETSFGNSGDGTMLTLVGVGGIPVFNPVLIGAFGSDCVWTIPGVIPPGVPPVVATFRTYAINVCGNLTQSNDVDLTFQ